MSGFLFGKLPGFGDFLARGLSVPMRTWWDDWCSVAVLDARKRFGAEFNARYFATPPRRFLIAPPGEGGCWQVGCLIPSTDQAGRNFPFVLGIGSSAPLDAAEGASIGERLAVCIEHGFQPDVDLDALIIAAEIAANDTAAAARRVHPITLRQTDWIGADPQGVEI